MSAYTRVLCYRWNLYGATPSWIATLTLVQPSAFKQHLYWCYIPCSMLLNIYRWWYYMTPRLGAVAFTVLRGKMSCPTVMLNALSYKAGRAIQLRSHPGDHELWHMEVPEGVPSVSTQCPGLFRVLEPSQRGASSRLSPPPFIEDATFREVDSGVCRGLLACWPSCRMEQSIHYHISEQQPSLIVDLPRILEILGNITWNSTSPSSGFTTWP